MLQAKLVQRARLGAPDLAGRQAGSRVVWYGMVWYGMVWYGCVVSKLQLSDRVKGKMGYVFNCPTKSYQLKATN
ncbi:hypothetical protein M0804_002362 [Polistes exclamans]|nr:hypothetical protein M0804_002362 [Polistes exclamans]